MCFISRRLEAFRKAREPSAEAQDAALLAQLARLGADLSRPRQQRHYFNFGSRDAAEHAASKIASEGFEVEVADVPQTHQWLVVATQTGVVSKEILDRLRPRLTELGKQVCGRYTGWEAVALG